MKFISVMAMAFTMAAGPLFGQPARSGGFELSTVSTRASIERDLISLAPNQKKIHKFVLIIISGGNDAKKVSRSALVDVSHQHGGKWGTTEIVARRSAATRHSQCNSSCRSGARHADCQRSCGRPCHVSRRVHRDIVQVEGGADSVVTIKVTFSPDTVMSQVIGFIDLDTDQNPATGLRAHANDFLPGSNQDIGAEYFLNIFPFYNRLVFVQDAALQIRGILFVNISGQMMQITVPLWMIPDDGNMNIGMVLGNSIQATDAAPNSGHGTITGSGPCPATVAVSDILDGNIILDTLHRFRDEVMLRNAVTRQYVDLYYKHGREMSAILQSTPWLRLRVALLMWRQRSTLMALLRHQPATLQEDDAGEIDTLIGVFLERAGPALSNDLKTIRQAVRDRSLLTLFGVRVTS